MAGPGCQATRPTAGLSKRVMAGLEPATQWPARPRGYDYFLYRLLQAIIHGADAPLLGGRVKPGHDDVGAVAARDGIR